jgi:hypothetical protein
MSTIALDDSVPGQIKRQPMSEAGIPKTMIRW